ncbi:hypothetical protein ACH3XW_26590 [Acanthocheilonema viteae]
MTLLRPHSDQISFTTYLSHEILQISIRSVLIKEKKRDMEENIKDEEEGDEELGEAPLDGYPIDLEFRHASHQRTESFRAFFRR